MIFPFSVSVSLMALSNYPFSSLVLVVVTTFISISFVPLSSTSQVTIDHQATLVGFRINLTHVDADKDLSSLQLIQHGIHRGRRGQCGLKRKIDNINNIEAPILRVKTGDFLVNLSIGTPPKHLLGTMDTGSDLIWTSCKPCVNCSNNYSYPVFDPKQSSSFANVSCSSKLCKALEGFKCVNNGCEYNNIYADNSMSEGYMATETFTFSAAGESNQQALVSTQKVGFGCGVKNEGQGLDHGAGIVGLGGGPLSLVSQLGLKKFSYCLSSKTGSLFLGSLADNLSHKNRIIKHTTPLIRNLRQPSFYYLSLEGITCGEVLLPIPKSIFRLTKEGHGGMIIDSGTTITLLQEDAFNMLKGEFLRQAQRRISKTRVKGFELCFDLVSENATKVGVPKLIFHFKGLDLKLPVENYMIEDTGKGITCLAMGATGSLSIFGNVQQKNMLVVHDIENEKLSFITTRCDKL